jgi:serine/threonine protein phosphatase PrpC
LTKLKIDFAAVQFLGARKNQEDAYALHPSDDKQHLVCLLADGMGGHAAGEIASNLVIDSFSDGFEVNNGPVYQSFVPLIDGANRALSRAVDANSEHAGMGCTFVALELIAEHYSWASIGDSPLFLIRDGSLRRMNADHSMASRLDAAAAIGEITWEEAQNSPDRNALLSALTGDQITRLDVTKTPHELQIGDWLILATDGLETLDNETILNVVEDAAEELAQGVVNALSDAVIAAGEPRQDNTTIIAIQLVPSDGESTDDVVTRPIRNR